MFCAGVLTFTSNLDYESVKLHTLNVSATDSSSFNPMTSYQVNQQNAIMRLQYGVVTIFVVLIQELIIYVTDVNDVAPRFERLMYDAEVLESQSSGAVVTRVNAFDADSGRYMCVLMLTVNQLTVDSVLLLLIFFSSLQFTNIVITFRIIRCCSV